MAGYFHDHLFVPIDKADLAVNLLWDLTKPQTQRYDGPSQLRPRVPPSAKEEQAHRHVEAGAPSAGWTGSRTHCHAATGADW